MDLVWIECIVFDDFFDFCYGDFVGYCVYWVEVVCGVVVNEVVGFVGFLCFDECDVGC